MNFLKLVTDNLKGAAMSIEDGAALAECLDRAQDINDVPVLLRAFEAIRKSRCEAVQRGSRANGDIWHLSDGPAQEERDRQMNHTQVLNGDSCGEAKNPNKWSDENFQPWLFGHDTVKAVGCRAKVSG